MMPNLYVSDVERAAAFYRDLLGGTETSRVLAEVPALHVKPYGHVSGTLRGYVTDPDDNWVAIVSKTTA